MRFDVSRAALALACFATIPAACADDSPSSPPGGPASPEAGSAGAGASGGAGGAGGSCTDCTPAGDTTFTLPSPPGARLWTTTTMDKVLREAALPARSGDAITLRAAKNEVEPFQIVVRADAATTATLGMTPFSGPSSIGRVELRRVGYVRIQKPSDATAIPSAWIPDPLEPASFGAPEALPAGENQPFWVTVHVPAGAAAGDYTSTLTVTVGGQAQAIPVKLHVFDFALPAKIGFDGNWNTSFQALGGSASLDAVRALKDFFFEHRLVPSSVAWPAGLNYNGGIEYDCASGTFKQEANDYDFSRLGPKYIDGAGWNGVGFPSFEIMQFVDNDTPRPQSFCGVDRGPTHQGTTAYNAEWSKLLAAIDAYLVSHGWAARGYYYVQNEPQGQADYDVAAFLANLTKTAAPHLRIAVSEEPKPEIAEHPAAAGHGYDLWWADLSHFEPTYAKKRQAAGERGLQTADRPERRVGWSRYGCDKSTVSRAPMDTNGTLRVLAAHADHGRLEGSTETGGAAAHGLRAAHLHGPDRARARPRRATSGAGRSGLEPIERPQGRARAAHRHRVP